MTEALRARLAAAGAVPVEEGGISVPAHFGDPSAEALRAARACAVSDLSSSVLLRVTGADRVSYLHRILSCDVAGLPSGGGTAGLLLTPKGKVVAGFRLSLLPDRVEMVAPAAARPALVDGLSRFAIADEVAFEDRAGRAGLLGVTGPLADAVVARVLGGPVPPLVVDGGADVEAAGAPATLFRRVRGSLPGWDLRWEAADLGGGWDGLLAAAEAAGGGPAGRAALEMLRVEAGEPRLGVEVGADTLPQEAGVADHVSFTKGCFLGQEPVARLQNRGHTNRGLAGLDLGDAPPPSPGAPVLDGDREVGVLGSAVRSPRLGRTLALALLRHESAAPGTPLRVGLPGGASVPAVAAALPFVAPG